MTSAGWKRTLLRALGLGDPENRVAKAAAKLKRSVLRHDRRIRNRYLTATGAAPCLHIGGGPRLIEGWLNTDLLPGGGVMGMDATRRFPFADNTFAFLFTEHMIEHVSYEGGAAMLRESYRVLRQGGIVRVVTPDLASLAALYNSPLTDLQRHYIDWFCGAIGPGRPATPAFVLNTQFRLWGHQFLYDEATLSSLLATTGFRDIRRFSLMQSAHPQLRNLENIGRYPEGLLEFESMALEAWK